MLRDITRKAIIIDLDGTLCDSSHRQKFMEMRPKDWGSFYAGIPDDEPNPHVVELIKYYLGTRHILFVTGRPEAYRDVTNSWLVKTHPCLVGHQLFMREDGDFRPDYVIKNKIYQVDIEPYYEVKLVLDDRTSVVKMWRDLGLECWQVANGDF